MAAVLATVTEIGPAGAPPATEKNTRPKPTVLLPAKVRLLPLLVMSEAGNVGGNPGLPRRSPPVYRQIADYKYTRQEVTLASDHLHPQEPHHLASSVHRRPSRRISTSRRACSPKHSRLASTYDSEAIARKAG